MGPSRFQVPFVLSQPAAALAEPRSPGSERVLGRCGGGQELGREGGRASGPNKEGFIQPQQAQERTAGETPEPEGNSADRGRNRAKLTVRISSGATALVQKTEFVDQKPLLPPLTSTCYARGTMPTAPGQVRSADTSPGASAVKD